MAKINVNASVCVGCGLCEQLCPEVFEVQADGAAHVKADACNSHNLKDVAEQCPVSAISVN